MENQLKVSKEKVEEMVREINSLKSEHHQLLKDNQTLLNEKNESTEKLNDTHQSATELHRQCEEWKGKYETVVREKTATDELLRNANHTIETLTVEVATACTE